VEATLSDGGEAVLKVNLPESETEFEGDAFERWNGCGAARIFDYDRERRALLIERLRPGTQGWALPDAAATAVAADVLEQLWVPAAAPFQTLEAMASYWVDFLPRHWESLGRSFERRLVDEAVAFLRDAGPTQKESVLLHQDFHGGNFLLSQRGWLAIDAKPLVGEREFDVASLIRDRRPTTKAAMERRIDDLVDRLALDRERVRGWSIAHALAWNGSARMVATAELLAS